MESVPFPVLKHNHDFSNIKEFSPGKTRRTNPFTVPNPYLA